ncbi:C-type lectin domain family 2 member D-like isoform X2 [Chrysemys picta bellii]|uniref:C-type lectin domain family 2 member D-like isoform X2 n=1 Tax=Chrysemys picta bellii TaxID=8478 RepID=UPI000CE64C7B|nr:C-type lectin domain family 2 member D-like isoform X2 [Chrysemys picta bellii]
MPLLETTSLAEREKMGNGSCPVEKMAAEPLLNSQEAQVKRNGETLVDVTTHGGERSKSSPIGCLSRIKSWARPFTILSVVLNIVLISLLIAWSVRQSERCLADPKSPEASCPDGWVGYQGKCYYFSETEGNWTYSQSQCSSLNASLAGINTQQEKVFMMRYKGIPEHWISFWREPNGTWKWANGTDLNNCTEEMERGSCSKFIKTQTF